MMIFTSLRCLLIISDKAFYHQKLGRTTFILAFITIVLHDAEADLKWYEGKELDSYLANNPNNEAAQSINRIKEVLGKNTQIRAYLKGIPNVFLDSNQRVSKEKVLNLINWN